MSFVDKDIFTDNDIIDNIEMNDSMVEITGYVEKLIAKSIAKNGSFVFRVILSNAQGRKVQLIAWQQYISKLESVAEINKVLTIDRTLSKYVMRGSKFNDGNVDFELVINQKSNIKVEGKYNPNEDCKENDPLLVDFNTIVNSSGLIRIKGYIKNNFYRLITKSINRGIGSITDGEKKLEVHISCFEDHEFQKGQSVEVCGVLCRRPNYSSYLRVATMTEINLLEESKQSLAFLLNGYRYLEMND